MIPVSLRPERYLFSPRAAVAAAALEVAYRSSGPETRIDANLEKKKKFTHNMENILQKEFRHSAR